MGRMAVTRRETQKRSSLGARCGYFAAFSAVLALGWPGSTALALEDTAAAKAHYTAGLQHFNLSEFEQALVEFKEGYRSKADPVFLFNIGQCHRKLGHLDEAITFYRTYLREAPDANNRSEVERRIEELESLRDAQNASITSSGATPRPSPVSQAAQAVAATAAAAPAPGVDLDAHAEERAAAPPIYNRWWFWATAGAVVVASATVAIVMARRDPTAVPTSTLGAQRAMP
jgi:tetratricopeptide (TPR) repeat protein